MTKRKVILYVAASLDGFIAKEDGDISFLSAVESPGEDYGYHDLSKRQIQLSWVAKLMRKY